MTVTFTVTITAANEEAALALREEIIGAIEDNRESRTIAADADVSETIEVLV